MHMARMNVIFTVPIDRGGGGGDSEKSCVIPFVIKLLYI